MRAAVRSSLTLGDALGTLLAAVHTIQAGQSLAVGVSGKPAVTTVAPEDRALWVPETGIPQVIVEPADSEFMTGNQADNETGLAWALAAAHSRLRNQSVLLTGRVSAVGGQGYATLKKGNAVYDDAIDALQACRDYFTALGLDFVLGFVDIIHGEQDTNFGVLPSTYLGYLYEWLADFTADALAITGQTLTPRAILAQTSSWDYYQGTVAEGLAQLQAHVDSALFTLACPQYPFTYAADTLHLTAPSYALMGEYRGRVRAALLNGDTIEPLRPLTATRTGLNVDVEFLVPVEPLVWDTVTVPEQPFRGFYYYDDAGSAMVQSVSILNATTVRLVLDQVPTGANPQVGYGSERSRYGNLRDSDPTPSASDPTKSLHNWCVHFLIAVGGDVNAGTAVTDADMLDPEAATTGLYLADPANVIAPTASTLTQVLAEAWPGASGAVWDAARWTVTQGNGGTATQSGAGKGRLSTTTTSLSYARARAAVANAVNHDVTALVQWGGNAAAALFSMGVRASAAWQAATDPRPVDGYGITWNSDSTDIQLRRWVGGALLALGTVTVAVDTQARYVRLRATGGLIQLKVWLATDPEPEAWSLAVIDETVTAAGGVSVGMRRVSGGPHTLDLGAVTVSTVVAGAGAQWNDLSGNARHLTRYPGADSPAFVPASLIGGKGAWRKTDAAQFFDPLAAAMPSGRYILTMLLASTHDTSTSDGYVAGGTSHTVTSWQHNRRLGSGPLLSSCTHNSALSRGRGTPQAGAHVVQWVHDGEGHVDVWLVTETLNVSVGRLFIDAATMTGSTAFQLFTAGNRTILPWLGDIRAVVIEQPAALDIARMRRRAASWALSKL